MAGSVQPAFRVDTQGKYAIGTRIPAISGTVVHRRTSDATRKARMEARATHAQGARLIGSVHALARYAGKFSPDHCVPLCGIQMQSRLLVLLVLQQQGPGNDGRRRE